MIRKPKPEFRADIRPVPAWRIDTLDARGGLAFATWRADDTPGSAESPCIFIGAPDFRPEPVANRAIALAAARGAFQAGLFVDGAEITFRTQSSVAEFVRRAYLRSGGGDGAEGGGGAETPGPGPVDQPNFPRAPEGEGRPRSNGPSLRNELVDTATKFRELSAGLAVGRHEEFHYWPAPRLVKPAASVDGADMLASAAKVLLEEAVIRLALARDPRELLARQREGRGLGELLARLGLWPVLLDEPYYGFLSTVVNNLMAFNAQNPLKRLSEVYREEQTSLVLYLLFIDGPALDDDQNTMPFLGNWYYWRQAIPLSWGGPRPVRDPLGDLLQIPLPDRVQKFVTSSPDVRVNLYHALTTFMGAPTRALIHDSVLIDLVLFASACIVSSDMSTFPSSTIGWPWQRHSRRASDIERVAADALADRASSWLTEHLPTIAFAQPLEAAIESAADLRYNATL